MENFSVKKRKKVPEDAERYKNKVQGPGNKEQGAIPVSWTLDLVSCLLYLVSCPLLLVSRSLSLKSQILPVFMPIMTDICPHFDIKQHNFSK
jgi:hypothetical protein